MNLNVQSVNMTMIFDDFNFIEAYSSSQYELCLTKDKLDRWSCRPGPPRAAPALRATQGGPGPGSWKYKHVLLIQLFPAEHGHRRVASGAVSEPAARMPSHGAAAGAESDGPGIRKDILKGYAVGISRGCLGYPDAV